MKLLLSYFVKRLGFIAVGRVRSVAVFDSSMENI